MTIKTSDFSSLGTLTQLGDGGEGVVYRVSGIPGQVYKEYKPAVLHEVDPRGLETTIGILDQLSGEAQAFVSQHSAWPHTLIQKNGVVCGFLMQEIPDEFSCEHGMVGRPRTVLTDWNKLVTRDDWMDKSNIESTAYKFDLSSKADESAMILLLLDLAQFFNHLHEHRVVVGDVSGRNILWTTSAAPSVFLIDCDGFRLEGDRAVTTSKQSPDWFDTDLTGETTLDSDRFKLATAIYRAYFSDPFGSPSSPKGSAGKNGDKILKLAQQGTSSLNRTSALAWCELLQEIESGRTRRPWIRKKAQPTVAPVQTHVPTFRPWKSKNS